MTQKRFFGHPAGLFVLFFTEMWERFSYYGMRALLVLYMTEHLLKAADNGRPVFGLPLLKRVLQAVFGPLSQQALASQIYGLYTGLVYLTPLFGGLLADRVLGRRRAVLLGGSLMAIGHFLMAGEAWFLPALLFLIVGNGCFKPNISGQVGDLYPPGDPRRDGAFTIFYMGVNLGAFFSPLVCGTLGQRYGWHYGFAAAGVGMLLGLLVYNWGRGYLPAAEQTLPRVGQAGALSAKDYRAIAALGTIALLNVMFWAVYEQQGNTLQLFAEHETDWHLFGWEMPSTWFQSLNPAFIFMLAPLIDAHARRQNARGRQASSIGKMALGAMLLGASFFVLIFAVGATGQPGKISFLWLALCTLVYTLGELYLSPVGLSLVSKIAPPRLIGLLMGIWFLSSFFGNLLSGYIGSFYQTMPRPAFFLLLSGLGIGTGLAILAVKPLLRKALGPV
ncbi:peptide MFS transporter [Methylomonas sp. DH-1]|uniref:peptide MFS transporter n=1 Tax=Methylomonas sp. (strain DH-1) TaxID=1727196 RepID=UPI0007C8D7AE|nr:peptide MFS transporter [Methylomonas sp. DH-1]ANE54830.1 peptide ABC transporter [Methylomonas sp. DH-1]